MMLGVSIDLQWILVSTDEDDRVRKSKRRATLNRVLICSIAHLVELHKSEVGDGVLIKEDELGMRSWRLILLSPGIPKGREIGLN
jgi:hypothetical protein